MMSTPISMLDTIRHYQGQLQRLDVEGPAAAIQSTTRSQVRRYAVLESFIPRDTLSVLDVGCGLGDFSGWLPPEVQYLGVDIVPEYLALAAQRHPSRLFRRWDARTPLTLPWPIDYAVFIVTFSYQPVEAAAAMVSAMWTVVEKGLLILDNNYDGVEMRQVLDAVPLERIEACALPEEIIYHARKP